MLTRLNEYFFQTYDGIGFTRFRDEDLQYFSEFHKFWEINHKTVLEARVDSGQARMAAAALKDAFDTHGPEIFDLTYNTHGLGREAIAQVRFFTANQDFRKPPADAYRKYLEDPTRFDPKVIESSPTGFLDFLNVLGQSQSDKRTDFARNAARFLLERGTTAYGLAYGCGNDAVKVRELLTSEPNMGYGPKKANMFIRDMFELGVWPDLHNIDRLDVPSDRNTMKIALRTRILRTAMPLLSSFLDPFCHQYGYIDEMTAKAWRAVWEQWRELDPKTAPASPCSIDFLVYRMGRDFCDTRFTEYVCDAGHRLYRFGSRLKFCPLCGTPHAAVTSQGKFFPCELDKNRLPREGAELQVPAANMLKTFDGTCIFETVCRPRTEEFWPFDPPRSISVKGETGWTTSYSDRKRGGAGMMA